MSQRCKGSGQEAWPVHYRAHIGVCPVCRTRLVRTAAGTMPDHEPPDKEAWPVITGVKFTKTGTKQEEEGDVGCA